jgi:hypothetical protein
MYAETEKKDRKILTHLRSTNAEREKKYRNLWTRSLTTLMQIRERKRWSYKLFFVPKTDGKTEKIDT